MDGVEKVGNVGEESTWGNGLVDEFRFIVEPFVMGSGRRFFAGGIPPTQLKLVQKKALGSGSLAVIYEVDKK